MSDIRSVTYQGAYAVTASDTVDDPKGPFAALEATTGGGTVKVTCIDGSVATLQLVLGIIKPISVKHVWSTGGGTATGVVGYVAVSKVL